MDDATDRRLRIAAARAGFLEGVDRSLRGVPDHVLASWRRSVSSGVHPGELTSDYHDDLDLGSRLVRCAQPVIERLLEQLDGVPTCVALTDHHARLLARRDSDPVFGRALDRMYFAQGFGYAEGQVGTNGVGTVLEFGESVHIVGAEHFVEVLQAYACAGAPVRDPLSGRIEGVLDISCFARDSTPIMHALVRSAAAEIGRNLLADRNQLQQALFDGYTRAELRCRGAVLAIGPSVVMANAAMQTLLGHADREALQDHVRFVMARRECVDEQLDLPSGTLVRLRGSTVTVGSAVAGMVGAVSLVDEPGRSRTPRVAAPPRTRLAPSSSPAWRAAESTVESALRDGARMLLLGEPGSGRYTMLAELLRAVRPHARVVAVAPEAVEAAPQVVAARLTLPGDVLHVLRDLDRLSPAALDGLVTVLADAPDGGASLAATATERWAATHGPSLGLFGASATVPPLRTRSGDLGALVTKLLADIAPHRDVRLTPEALRVLGRHDWPGNVRELAEVLAEALRRRPVGRVEAGDLPASCQSTARSELRAVDRVQRDAIVAALHDNGGNRVAAAAALGVARSTLYRKIRQYGITS